MKDCTEIKFSERVYRLCKQIPKGKVTTYKAIAGKLEVKAYRAVGQALRNNPSAPEVPCHRVISSDGSLGGFKGELGNKEKIYMLEREGVEIVNYRIDLDKFFHKFKNNQ